MSIMDSPEVWASTMVVPLSNGMTTIVDAEDYERVTAAGPWHYQGPSPASPRTNYAIRSVRSANGRWTTQSMHRFLMPGVAGHVDHRNGNGLDNRRTNLREATASTNAGNAGLHRTNTSGFRGVSWDKRRETWYARLFVTESGTERNRYLGRFDTPDEAARAYDAAARQYFDEFARLNFPRPGERGLGGEIA